METRKSVLAGNFADAAAAVTEVSDVATNLPAPFLIWANASLLLEA
jgi:hypothetical protein